MSKPKNKTASTKQIAKNAVKGGPKSAKKDVRTSAASRGREKGG